MNEINSVPTKKQKVGGYVSDELKQKAQAYSSEYRISESQLVVDLLEMFLSLDVETLRSLSVMASKERRTPIEQAGVFLEIAIREAQETNST